MTSPNPTIHLTEEPEPVNWPEMHYVFIQKTGPFAQTAGQAWTELHRIRPKIEQRNTITGYMSLYKIGSQVYRAGVSLAAPPDKLPEGMRYEKFSGGKYSRFVLTGPFTQLGEATGRACKLVAERQIPLRDDFNIEHYVKDPRITPEAELITHILFPTA
jgi:predicted transcriptional regulator YdeE